MQFKLLISFAFLFSSCASGTDSHAPLEVTSVHYESVETLHCNGEVKNISAAPFSELKVEVEFQMENGERVRGNTVDLAQREIQPNTGSTFLLHT